MSKGELKRYYCVIEFIEPKTKMVHLILHDSDDINTKHTAVTPAQKLEDKGLIVYDQKNFHLVIMPDGEWNIFWIKESRLSSSEEDLVQKAFSEVFSIHYKQR